MKRWMETIKTVVLVLLVAVSFLLTSLLWSNQPQLAFISPTTYMQSRLLGMPVKAEEMIAPKAFLFHYGDNQHTLALPGSDVYRKITAQLRNWYFYEFTEVSMTKEKWRDLLYEKEGMEVRYRTSIPLTMLGQVFSFSGDISDMMTGVNRIWLYYNRQEDTVEALFLSDSEKVVVQAQTIVTKRDLQTLYLSLGEKLPRQSVRVVEDMYRYSLTGQWYPYWQTYELPVDRLTLPRYRMNYQTLSERSLIEALFIDPTLVRKIVERDQTIIYTDGNRSVQFRPGQETMTFTDPALPDQQTEPSLEEKLRNSVSFVNQYIGWTDPFYLESVEQRAGEGEVFTFRHYLGPYPIVTDQAQGLEKLSITSYNGQVISLRRSLYNLGTVIKSREMQILSGPELLELLRSWELDANKLRNAYLAYRLVLHESYAECIPVWVLEWTDGKQELVDASVPEEGGVYGGLE